jgi:hypothetical protein
MTTHFRTGLVAAMLLGLLMPPLSWAAEILPKGQVKKDIRIGRVRFSNIGFNQVGASKGNKALADQVMNAVQREYGSLGTGNINVRFRLEALSYSSPGLSVADVRLGRKKVGTMTFNQGGVGQPLEVVFKKLEAAQPRKRVAPATPRVPAKASKKAVAAIQQRFSIAGSIELAADTPEVQSAAQKGVQQALAPLLARWKQARLLKLEDGERLELRTASTVFSYSLGGEPSPLSTLRADLGSGLGFTSGFTEFDIFRVKASGQRQKVASGSISSSLTEAPKMLVNLWEN